MPAALIFFNLTSVHTNPMSPWTHAWHRPSRPNSYFLPTRGFLKSHTRTDLSTLKSTHFLLTGGFVFCYFPSCISPVKVKEKYLHSLLLISRCLQVVPRKARIITLPFPSPMPFSPKNPFSTLLCR